MSQADSIFYNIAAERDWTPETQRAVLDEYIQNQNANDAFDEFLQARAEDEGVNDPEHAAWDDDSYVALMLNYIRNQESDDVFEDFLKEKVSFEDGVDLTGTGVSLQTEKRFLDVVNQIAGSERLQPDQKVDQILRASYAREHDDLSAINALPKDDAHEWPHGVYEAERDKELVEVVASIASLTGDTSERAERIADMVTLYHEHDDTELLDKEYQDMVDRHAPAANRPTV